MTRDERIEKLKELLAPPDVFIFVDEDAAGFDLEDFSVNKAIAFYNEGRMVWVIEENDEALLADIRGDRDDWEERPAILIVGEP